MLKNIAKGLPTASQCTSYELRRRTPCESKRRRRRRNSVFFPSRTKNTGSCRWRYVRGTSKLSELIRRIYPKMPRNQKLYSMCARNNGLYKISVIQEHLWMVAWRTGLVTRTSTEMEGAQAVTIWWKGTPSTQETCFRSTGDTKVLMHAASEAAEMLHRKMFDAKSVKECSVRW